MFRIIIILVLAIYLLNKLSVFIFRMAGPRQAPPNFRRQPEGHINVNMNSAPKKGKGGVKGGEYVDYEEVKE